MSFTNQADDGGQVVQLELVSVTSGRLMAVPETWLSSDALISFGWPVHPRATATMRLRPAHPRSTCGYAAYRVGPVA